MPSLVLHAQYAVVHQDGIALMETCDPDAFAIRHLPRGTFLRLVSIQPCVVEVSLSCGEKGWIDLKGADDLPTIDRWDEDDDGWEERPVALIEGAEYEVSIPNNLYWDAPTWEGRGHVTWMFDENMLVGQLQRGTRVKLVSEPVHRRSTLKSLYTSRSHVGDMFGDYGEVLVLDGHFTGEFGFIQFNIRERPMLRLLNKACEVDEEHLAADLEECMGAVQGIEFPEFSSPSSSEAGGLGRWIMTALGQEREKKRKRKRRKRKKASVSSVRLTVRRLPSDASFEALPRRFSVCREKKRRSTFVDILPTTPSMTSSNVLFRLNNEEEGAPPPLLTPSRRKSKTLLEDTTNKKKKWSLHQMFQAFTAKMKSVEQSDYNKPRKTTSSSPAALREQHNLHRSISLPSNMSTKKSRSTSALHGPTYRYHKGPAIVLDAPEDSTAPPMRRKKKSEKVEVNRARSRKGMGSLISKMMGRTSKEGKPFIFRRKSMPRRLSRNGVFSPPPTTRPRRESRTSGNSGVLLVHHKRSSFLSLESNQDDVDVIPSSLSKQRIHRQRSGVPARRPGRSATADGIRSKSAVPIVMDTKIMDVYAPEFTVKTGDKGKGARARRASHVVHLDSAVTIDRKHSGVRSHRSTWKSGERSHGKGADARHASIASHRDSNVTGEREKSGVRSHGSTWKNAEKGHGKGLGAPRESDVTKLDSRATEDTRKNGVHWHGSTLSDGEQDAPRGSYGT